MNDKHPDQDSSTLEMAQDQPQDGDLDRGQATPTRYKRMRTWCERRVFFCVGVAAAIGLLFGWLVGGDRSAQNSPFDDPTLSHHLWRSNYKLLIQIGIARVNSQMVIDQDPVLGRLRLMNLSSDPKIDLLRVKLIDAIEASGRTGGYVIMHDDVLDIRNELIQLVRERALANGVGHTDLPDTTN